MNEDPSQHFKWLLTIFGTFMYNRVSMTLSVFGYSLSILLMMLLCAGRFNKHLGRARKQVFGKVFSLEQDHGTSDGH
ncbi:hypothetical protein EPI10_006235 [Gossypium australe]|uniref:Uncharacterized protein n=1 Tax=Gossypium australe TaxID=47621 RepID=A0A5B6WQM7_9ROSI|nr:hypothetical protein EPI10_006235 [Gossypium australe]